MTRSPFPYICAHDPAARPGDEAQYQLGQAMLILEGLAGLADYYDQAQHSAPGVPVNAFCIVQALASHAGVIIERSIEDVAMSMQAHAGLPAAAAGGVS